MRFSQRPSLGAPNAIARANKQAISRGLTPLNLADSNPTRWGLGFGKVPYQPHPQGQPLARESLAAWLASRDNRSVNPDNLYLLSSTSQGYAWLTQLLCDPGERVAAPTPGYPLVETITGLEAAGVAFYPLTWVGSRWEMSAEVPEQVRAVVAINPNNPTGSYVHAEDRVKLLGYCREHDVPLIADEVFFDFDLPGSPSRTEDRQRLAGTPDVLTFALDGMSKSLGAPGLKVAWLEVSGPESAVQAAKNRLGIIADAYLPFSDVLAASMGDYLAAIPAAASEIRERCRTNLLQLQKIVSAEPSGVIDLLEPEGGWNALLRLPSYVDEDTLITGLIREHGITAQPGYYFDMPFSAVVSVSLLPQPHIFANAARTLMAHAGSTMSIHQAESHYTS